MSICVTILFGLLFLSFYDVIWNFFCWIRFFLKMLIDTSFPAWFIHVINSLESVIYFIIIFFCFDKIVLRILAEPPWSASNLFIIKRVNCAVKISGEIRIIVFIFSFLHWPIEWVFIILVFFIFLALSYAILRYYSSFLISLLRFLSFFFIFIYIYINRFCRSLI